MYVDIGSEITREGKLDEGLPIDVDSSVDTLLKAAETLLEDYAKLTLDFQMNKKIAERTSIRPRDSGIRLLVLRLIS